MATLTTTLGNVELTIDELRSLLSATPTPKHDSPAIAEAIVEVKATRKASAPKQTTNSAPKQNSDGGFVVEANCGHTVTRNSPRGRKPAQCADCKNGNSETPKQEKKQQTPPEQRKDGGNKGGGRYSPKPLEEMPDDVPATDAQMSRIAVQLNERKVSAKVKKSYQSEISDGISVRRAAEMYRTLKKLPLA